MTVIPEVGQPNPGANKSASVTLSQCVAILVTWHPDLTVLQRLMSKLLQQGVDVTVVDNGSSNQSDIAALIASLAEQYSNKTENELPPATITWLPWAENQGLAAGMNRGLSWATQHQYQLAWLFDQDSDLNDGFCRHMLSAWQSGCQLTEKLAALGPRLVDPETGRQTPFRRFRLSRRSDCKLPGSDDLYMADFLISSGTLLSLSSLKEIGDMKVSYFIDNVDLEWCFRALSHGWQILGCDRAQLLHNIGEASNNPLVKRGVMVSHGPLRYYYSTRNRIHLRRQSYAPFDWVWRDHLRFLIKTAFLMATSQRRAEYWRAFWRARRDSRELRE